MQAINDPDVDTVLIATPGKAHEAQLNACLDREIPVLCEKPLTTDVASAFQIVQKESALGRQLIQVGFMLIATPGKAHSVVHEVDMARFLLDEEIATVQVLKGAATKVAPAGTALDLEAAL